VLAAAESSLAFARYCCLQVALACEIFLLHPYYDPPKVSPCVFGNEKTFLFILVSVPVAPSLMFPTVVIAGFIENGEAARLAAVEERKGDAAPRFPSASCRDLL
jgi:hypothetical protein